MSRVRGQEKRRRIDGGDGSAVHGCVVLIESATETTSTSVIEVRL